MLASGPADPAGRGERGADALGRTVEPHAHDVALPLGEAGRVGGVGVDLVRRTVDLDVRHDG
jgi:hypothetical protein